MRNKHTKRAEAAGHKIWPTPDTYTHARTHINTCTPPKYTTRGDWRLEVKKKAKQQNRRRKSGKMHETSRNIRATQPAKKQKVN